jgi:hypothetical protein
LVIQGILRVQISNLTPAPPEIWEHPSGMLRDEELCGKQPLYMEETLKVFAANQGLDKNFPSMVCRVLNLRKKPSGSDLR